MRKLGDKVLVWDDEEDEKVERVFLCEIKGAAFPIACVAKGYEKKFKDNLTFVMNTDSINWWKNATVRAR